MSEEEDEMVSCKFIWQNIKEDNDSEDDRFEENLQKQYAVCVKVRW